MSIVGIRRIEYVKSSKAKLPALIRILVVGAAALGAAKVSVRKTRAISPPLIPPSSRSISIVDPNETFAGDMPNESALTVIYINESGPPIRNPTSRKAKRSTATFPARRGNSFTWARILPAVTIVSPLSTMSTSPKFKSKGKRRRNDETEIVVPSVR